jgi:uncharacterized protein YktB (UPF0637 family)
MLRASPTSADFVLNFNKFNPMGLMSALMKFIFWSINDDPQKAKRVNALLKEKDTFAENLPEMYGLLKDFSKVENKSPISTIISSLFMFDFMNKNFVEHTKDEKVLADVLNDLLLPKIRTK